MINMEWQSELVVGSRTPRRRVDKPTLAAKHVDEQSILHRMEYWGYYLLPKSHPEGPGYTGLLVAIRETPTVEHFDPESIHLRIIEEDKDTYWATFRSKVVFKKSKNVGPGKVSLRDRIDKRVDFFTFGGLLEAVSISGETVYSLRSPAPILDFYGSPESVAAQLAFETEAMIAVREARWGSNEYKFLRPLAQMDPFELYLACIHSILQHYQQSPVLRRTFYHFYTALLREKKWLIEVDQWPAMPNELKQLFAPD
jgi:hypothetical protein